MLPNAAKSKNKGGRPKLDKVTVSIRLSKSVLAQARQASARGGNMSAWIEQAIQNQLALDALGGALVPASKTDLLT